MDSTDFKVSACSDNLLVRYEVFDGNMVDTGQEQQSFRFREERVVQTENG